MNEFFEIYNTSGITCSQDIKGYKPQLSGDCDCVTDNCGGGYGACECNCDCADE